MNKNKQIFERFVDHIVTPFSDTTATGLSNLIYPCDVKMQP